jgi:hypothetical protein
MDKRSKKRRRKQNRTESLFELEMARLATQLGIEVNDSNDAITNEKNGSSSSSSSSSSTSSSSSNGNDNKDSDVFDTEETLTTTTNVNHAVLSRATQFIASSNWSIRSKKKFDDTMLLQPLRWRPPQTLTNNSNHHQHHQQQHGKKDQHNSDERDLVATCINQIRDARECIFAIRSVTWCQSCLEGISNTFLSMQTFGNPLLAQNEDVVVNLRRLLTSLRGAALDPVTHIRILCDLDDMYHRCYYHMMTRKDDNYSKSKYPNPIEYLTSTTPDTTKVVLDFLKLYKNDKHTTAHQNFQTGKETENPLLDGLNLRWKETLCLFYETGLAKDG